MKLSDLPRLRQEGLALRATGQLFREPITAVTLDGERNRRTYQARADGTSADAEADRIARAAA